MMHILNAFFWAITIPLITIVGIKMSKKLKWAQFRFDNIIKSLDKNILKTLFLTLAGRIGVGSIAGVALAIYVGGPGTIFWMWVITFISASITYSESVLAVKYGGGPSHYIQKGLDNKFLAKSYAILVIIAYLLGFIPIQANTIIKSLPGVININPLIIGIVIATLIFIIIKDGSQKIIKVTNKMIPTMGLLYILLALFVIVDNIEKIPSLLKAIIVSAFNIKTCFFGTLYTLIIGVQRGIFANESGLGLGAMAVGVANSKNPNKVGYAQVLGVYLTTCVICSATAILILLYNYNNAFINHPNGIEIATLAFNYHFNGLGPFLLVICICLFSFSTVLTGHYYCQQSFKFLSLKTRVLAYITPFSIILGSISSPSFIWDNIDILVVALGTINIYTINKLNKEIVSSHQKYDRI